MSVLVSASGRSRTIDLAFHHHLSVSRTGHESSFAARGRPMQQGSERFWTGHGVEGGAPHRAEAFVTIQTKTQKKAILHLQTSKQ